MSGRLGDRISVTGEGSHAPLCSTSAFQLSSLHLSQIVLCIYLRFKSTVDKADRLLTRGTNFMDGDKFKLCNIKQKSLFGCPVGPFSCFHSIWETVFESYLAIRVSVNF